MSRSLSNNEILLISSYPPRACGIATYSQDLRNALHKNYGHTLNFSICALERGTQDFQYDDTVRYKFNTEIPDDYLKTAHRINDDKQIKAVLLQHEFGLFGGEYGEYLMLLLKELQKPVYTTFHTVLPEPNELRREIVRQIAEYSEKLIVMTHQSEAILKSYYDVDEEQIAVIPHGTHIPLLNNMEKIRAKYNLGNRPVLSTFGLLSSNKSIETALDALPEIVQPFPEVLYLVLGKTHPEVVKKEGEDYREYLEKKVKALGIEKNVRFVNKYLELNELLEYLIATDIYLFTSKDPNQAVSGTFAYALSAGCPIISTAIPHAKEMLDEYTGILIDFQNPEQLAFATKHLLSNEDLRKSMSRHALNRTRPTHWVNVALQTGQLFKKHLSINQTTILNYPEISLDHIKRMTTNTGIIQFSKLSKPDLESGYTLDDNARALVAMINYYELYPIPIIQRYISTYMRFISKCQQWDGKFLNYLNSDREFTVQNRYSNLEDSNGRAIWALGRLISTYAEVSPLIIDKAEEVMQKFMPNIPGVRSPRSIAFIIKGLYFYNKKHNSEAVTHLIEDLANKLVERYHEVSSKRWQWFEEYLTYANSTLPEAALYAYLETGKGIYQLIARTTLNFLLSHLFQKDHIKVISNNGWFHYNQDMEEFGEQPIDVAYTIETLEVFYKAFKEPDFREKMDIAFSWFLGNNHLQQAIYNHATGGCYDGLEEHNVNLNQGAESTVCYLNARLIMERQFQHIPPRKQTKEPAREGRKIKLSNSAANRAEQKPSSRRDLIS